jgi:hypothetical protein
MSTLWTPEGEHPVDREAGQGQPGPTPPPDPGRRPPPGGGGPQTEEELQAQLADLRDQLAKTPAAVVIGNHAFSLFELAALHLSLQPPQLGDAQLAIDALGALVEGLGARLGEHQTQLQDGLAQLRMAYVQISAASAGGEHAGQGGEGGSGNGSG